MTEIEKTDLFSLISGWWAISNRNSRYVLLGMLLATDVNAPHYNDLTFLYRVLERKLNL